MTELLLTCTGLEDGGRFPLRHTGRGEDVSPEFLLHNLSPEAKTLAVTLEDLSHPLPRFTHWVIWNIPAAPRVPPGIAPGRTVPALDNARQGVAYGLHRYAGPKPPKGRRHRYRFTVYALDRALSLRPCAAKGAFLRAAETHILQKGSVTGEFA